MSKKYDKKVICFLDILGFTNIVYNKSKEEVETIFNDVSSFAKLILQDTNLQDSDIQITNFSDSIVISYNLDSENQLVFIIQYLQDMLIHFIKIGILIRGAITRGELFHLNNTVFGSGLIEAYALESKVAIYPRIIIRRDVLWFEKFSPEFEQISQESLIKNLQLDLDGWHYIDFLNIINNFSSLDEYLSYISKILDLITKYSIENIEVKLKYGWLNKKINDILKNLIQQNLYEQELSKLNELQQKCRNNTMSLNSIKY